MANRIAIVGISGSGKSVFSRRVAAKTGLPLIHMDQLFWRGNWEAIPESEYLVKHAEIIKGERWIIEGYIDKKMAERAKRADVIVYLDYSGPRCAWRVFKRWIQHRKISRPELDREAYEELNWDFIWMVFKGGEEQDIRDVLEHVDAPKVFRARSPKELEKVFIRV